MTARDREARPAELASTPWPRPPLVGPVRAQVRDVPGAACRCQASPEELRAALIAAGAIRPAPADRLHPVRLSPGLAVLRLDEPGRRAAAGRVALGRAGRWDTLVVETGAQPIGRRA